MSAELEILDVLNRYLHAIDTRRLDEVRDCFTDDATATYAGDVGAQNTRADIVGAIERAGAASQAVWGASMHALANWRIHVTSETTAVSSTIVEAVLVDVPRGSGRGVRRGLRYTDTLVKTSEGWRIKERRHELLWSYAFEAASIAEAPALRRPAAKLTAPPPG